MNANEILKDAYGRVGESVPAVLDGLTSDQAAWQPEGSANSRGNSVGWLVWHLTRVLDSHVAEAWGRDQLAASAGYEQRLGLDLAPGDTGYGHSEADVAKVRFEDLDVLAEYHAAVQRWAGEYLDQVGDLSEVVDENWDPPVTLGVRLVSVADDMARHVGQAEYVRGILPSSL